MKVLEEYSPDSSGEYCRLEEFQGLRQYRHYGTKKAARGRFISWLNSLGMLDQPYCHQWTTEEIFYAKEQIDMAFEEAFKC